MKAYYIIAAAIVSAVSCLSSSRAVADQRNSLIFTRVNHDPVTAAMGGVGIVQGSAYSSFRNPAALSFWDKKFDVAAGYQSWSAQETQNVTAGVAGSIGKVSLAVGANYGFYSDGYGIADDYEISGGTFHQSELQVNLGAAWKFLPFLSIGADFKYLSNKLSTDYSANAFSVDAFLTAKIAGFKVAAGISSIGTKIKGTDGEKYGLPASVTIGAGYGHTFGKHGINILADWDYYYSNNDHTLAVGAEYTYNKLVSVRAGYHYGSEVAVVPSYASVGVGVQFIGIRIDFAYMFATDRNSALKDTLTAGLGFSF